MKNLFALAFLSAFGVSVASGQVTIVSENFESGSPPASWTKTQSTPSVGWEFGTSLGSAYFPIGAHTRYAASNDDAHDDNSTTANLADKDRLISPVMNLTTYAASGVVLQFEYLCPGNYGSTAHVEWSTDGGTTWTNLQTLAPASNWTKTSVNLTSLTSHSSVQICFRHNDNGNWADGFGVDDVVIRSLAPTDGAVVSVNNEPYVNTGSLNIEADIMNAGSNTITSCTLSYTINGGAPVTAALTGLSIASLATTTLTHPTPANLPTAAAYDICVTISNVNGGGADGDPTNDESCTGVSALSLIPDKKVVLEDHTGAWCQFCPDGTVVAEEVASTYPGEAYVVAIHNSDAMDIPDGNTISGQYISGYPGGIIDNYYWEDAGSVEMNRGEWVSRVGDRLGMVSPMAVTVENGSYDAATRTLTFDVRVNSYGIVNGDLRVNAWIIEDSVTGSGTGYNQVNYYNTVAGHPFFGAGNPIIGFVHDHVARAMLSGPWGATGTIPNPATDGGWYVKTYTTVLDASWDENQIKVLGMAQGYDADPNARPIWNSYETTIDALTGANKPAEMNGVVVSPNPFSESTNITFSLNGASDVTVQILDLQGKVVAQLANGNFASGSHSLNWDGSTFSGAAANGVYMVSIRTAEGTSVQKVVLAR